MIRVKTKLGRSRIHGIGLFADEFIPKGTITWKYHPLFDTAYSMQQIRRMSKPAQQQFFHYAYYDKPMKKYVLCFDDQRFINHSSKHATILSTPHHDMAVRDIHPGEELLCDYNKFDDTYFKRLGIKPNDLKDW